MDNIDLNLLRVFMAVAQDGNFTAAASRLGVTRSAVSQSVRRLEDMHGIALVSRTTRSVKLTEAGEKLFHAIAKPLSDINLACDLVAQETAPRGILRIAVTSIAEPFLSGPLIVAFSQTYPEIILDITVTDDEFDIVDAGFDAGVRLGEVIEQDMIAVALSVEQREAVVASPCYIACHGVPKHPRDVLEHRCIGWRPSPNVAPYRWEFEDNNVAFDVAVNPVITTNDLQLMIRTALEGGGITYAMEASLREYIENGTLVPMLQDYLPLFPGFYLYFPNRRNMAPKLRVLIDFIRQARKLNEK